MWTCLYDHLRAKHKNELIRRLSSLFCDENSDASSMDLFKEFFIKISKLAHPLDGSNVIVWLFDPLKLISKSIEDFADLPNFRHKFKGSDYFEKSAAIPEIISPDIIIFFASNMYSRHFVEKNHKYFEPFQKEAIFVEISFGKKKALRECIRVQIKDRCKV